MQPTQEHITGRNTFDNHNVKNSSNFNSTYNSLVDECSCIFCNSLNFDTQPCTTRLHSQPVENYLDITHSGQISTTCIHSNSIPNKHLDSADFRHTNFTTPQPAIASSNVESSKTPERYSQQNYFQNYNPMEQCPISTNENLGPYPEYPKSHSVALLDDRAIPISFGHEILTSPVM